MVKRLIILFLLLPQLLGATDYYVKNGGNDASAGTSDGTAWATVSKVNGSSFSAGDRIFFQRGSIWEEQLTPPSSGSSSAQITFGTYGNAIPQPIITARGSLSGWNSSGNWSNEGSNRWSISYSGNYRIRVWLSGAEARRAQATADMNSTRRFYYSSSRLWVYATTNPASAYSNVEISSIRSYACYINGRTYLTFQEIDFRGSGGAGYSCVQASSSSNLSFIGCSIGMDAGCYGLRGSYTSTVAVTGCIFDTGDAYEDYYQSETSEDGCAIFDGCNYWTISGNLFKNWGHTALAWITYGGATTSYNQAYDNTFTAPDIDYGRAFQYAGWAGYMTNNKFYRNYIYDMPIGTMLGGPYVEFYNNIIVGIVGTPYDYYDTGQGLAIQELSDQGHTVHYMKIFNNTIINCVGGGIKYIGWENEKQIRYNEVSNNIIYNCGTEVGYALDCDNYTTLNNNTFRNNLIYTPGVTYPIYYRGSTYSAATFNTADSNSDVISGNIGTPPQFISTTDFHLQLSSPARFAGVTTLSGTDYDLRTWDVPSAIGAYEYWDGINPPPPSTDAGILKHMGRWIVITGKLIKIQ